MTRISSLRHCGHWTEALLSGSVWNFVWNFRQPHVQRIVGVVRRLRHQDDVLETARSMLELIARDVDVLGREVILVGHKGWGNPLSA